jgi:hypothetical protein
MAYQSRIDREETEMRRLLVWTLATGMVLLAGGQHAMAKEGHEDPRAGAIGVISRVPDNLRPGQVWTATITFLKDGRVVDADGFLPIVTIRNLGTGEVTSVTPFLQRPGVYTARIVFAQAGHWSVRVHDSFTGRPSDITTFRISPTSSATPGSRSFPVWTWIMAALMSLLLVAGVFLFLPRLRRKRVAVS